MAPRTRPATAADARAVAAVHVAGWQHGYRGLVDQAFLDGITVDAWELGWHERLAEPGVTVLVHSGGAGAGAVVDGSTRYGPCRDAGPHDVGEVYGLYVHPGAWGTGVGRALLAAAVDDLRSRAAGPHPGPVALWTLAGDVRARRFYERLGWHADGARREVHRVASVTQPAISFSEVRYRLEPARPAC